MNNEAALIVLSGGQDSATCLALAKWQGFDPLYTISFDYGQRHRIELECAEKLAKRAGAIHKVVPINTFEHIAVSRLLEKESDISEAHPIDGDLPASFVPGRNLIFLTFAAAYAYGLGIRKIFTGVCETDFSGYPDCRKQTIDALELAINLGLGLDQYIKIETPLMHITKAETIKKMQTYRCLDWYEDTHTCYNGQRPPCGKCPACKLREKGFEEAGVYDPLITTVRVGG